MSYTRLLFFHWFRNRISDVLLSIPFSAIIALFVLFFGNVIAGQSISYLSAWKWSYLVLFGIFIFCSLPWYVFAWRRDHILAKKWDVNPETVFYALRKLKLLKRKKYKYVMKWTAAHFQLKYCSISKIDHNF